MANVCEYHIKVKGTKSSCYALFDSMNVLDDKWINEEHGTDSEYTMVFQGDCKWAVDYGDTPLKEKSELFHVEVWCNSIDIDEPMGIFCEHYLLGEKDRIRYADMPDEIKMEEYEEYGEVGEYGQYGEYDDTDILDMLEAGVPIEAVADMTGKSADEIEAIVRANSDEE